MVNWKTRDVVYETMCPHIHATDKTTGKIGMRMGSQRNFRIVKGECQYCGSIQCMFCWPKMGGNCSGIESILARARNWLMKEAVVGKACVHKGWTPQHGHATKKCIGTAAFPLLWQTSVSRRNHKKNYPMQPVQDSLGYGSAHWFGLHSKS
jgi:hypothetical protein